MPDELDNLTAREDHITQLNIDACRQKSHIDPGKPGDCDLCGEWSGRLIQGVCSPCRDRRGLP